MSESMIRDISLADEGIQRIQWVEKFMPALNALREDFIKDQTFKGKTIVMSIHLEAKTAYLALTLQAAGANVIATGSNPLSTQDPIAAGL
ncbi:MAG TPA: adenosylhomocysteinase, partial [Dialister sp.]|nr:adenosylhomocysteinase [Dialister sp.]